METQTMVKRPFGFFNRKFKEKKLTRSWPSNWRGCFGHRVKWDAPS
jgi:hypothetical protein